MKKKNRKVKIVAVVGMAGSGKTTVCQFFKEKGMPVLRFGKETDIGLRELGLPINEENEKWYREKLRKELGMAAYAIKIRPRIERKIDGGEMVALDGLYSWEEYIYLKKHFENLILLAVYTPPEKRYKRLAGRKVRKLEKEKAKRRDIAEIENLNKGGPIAFCDILVVNDKNKLDLKKKVDKVYKKISGRD